MSEETLGRGVLVSAGEIAEMAGVSPSAVSNWRRRHPESFPAPAQETPAGDLFHRAEVEAWLEARGKGRAAKDAAGEPTEGWRRSVDESWSDLSRLMRSWGRLTQGRLLTWLQLLYIRSRLHVSADPTEGGFSSLWDRILSDPATAREEWARVIDANPERLGSELVQALAPADRVPVEDLKAARWIEQFFGTRKGPESSAVAPYGALTDHLIHGKWNARGSGEAVTTRPVATLAIKLLSPVQGSLYDPAFGLGSFLSAGWRARSEDDLRLCGQELTKFGWQVAYVRLLLHGAQPDLRTGDTLLDDQFSTLRADRIAVDPPWGDRLRSTPLPPDARWWFDRPPKSSEWLWVYHLLFHLSAQGRGVILIPSGLSDRGGQDRDERLRVLELDHLDAVIDLPPGLARRSSVAPTMLLFDKIRQGRRGRVLFIDARTLGTSRRQGFRDLEDEHIERIGAVVRDWRDGSFEPEARFSGSATLEEIRGDDAVWTPARYIRYVARTTKIDGERLDKRLGRLVEETGPGLPDATVDRVRGLLRVVRGLRTGSGRRWENVRLGDLLTEPPRTGSRQDTEGEVARVPFVETDQVEGTGRPVRGKPSTITRGSVGSRTTRAGDLLLTSRGVDESRPPRCAVVEYEEPLAYSESLMRLRPNTELVAPEYLRLFLTSHEGHMALAAVTSGTTISNLRADAIEHIEIPLPDLATQRQIVDAAQAAEAAIEELDAFSDRMKALTETLHEGLISGTFVPQSEAESE